MLFDPNIPIYAQIVELFKRQIVSGALPPGSRLPPVRELAVDLGVNPNTLQRALAELERGGLVFAERTSGRFVTSDRERIGRARRELSDRLIGDFISVMRELGYGFSDIPGLISEFQERNGQK